VVGASCTLSFKHSTSDYLDAVNPFYLLQNIYMRKMTRNGHSHELVTATCKISDHPVQTELIAMKQPLYKNISQHVIPFRSWNLFSQSTKLMCTQCLQWTLLKSSVSVNALQKRVTYSQALPTSDELRLQTRSTFLTAHSHCTTNSNTFQSLQQKHKTQAWDIQSLIS
jgi:hypothetical protein